MFHAGAVRALAIGVLLSVVAACGGGGGSGDNAATGQAIPLPDVEKATEKRLTADNINPALILATNFAEFIDGVAAPYPVVYGYGAGSSFKMRISHKLRSQLLAYAPVDISQETCLSGKASGEELVSGKVRIKFVNCDVGDVVFNGFVVSQTMESLPAGAGVFEITTLEGLRLTAADGSLDAVFDGEVSIMISDRQYGDLGETGMIDASLDVRDLQEQKGASLRSYQAGFTLVSADGIGLAANIFSRSGTIYDSGEYFVFAMREPENEGSMFLSSNVLEYLPLQNAVREMVRLPAVPISMSLHGHESDVYVYDDMSTGEVTIRLDVPRDPADKPDFAEIQPGIIFPHLFPYSKIDYYLHVDPDQLDWDPVNDSAPVIDTSTIATSVTVGQYFVIPHLDVSDPDQQFVRIAWKLVSQPETSSPVYFSWNDGFIFSSSVPGIYEFRVTADDGAFVTEQNLAITVIGY